MVETNAPWPAGIDPSLMRAGDSITVRSRRPLSLVRLVVLSTATTI
jgi:hypothetical protein